MILAVPKLSIFPREIGGGLYVSWVSHLRCLAWSYPQLICVGCLIFKNVRIRVLPADVRIAAFVC